MEILMYYNTTSSLTLCIRNSALQFQLYTFLVCLMMHLWGCHHQVSASYRSAIICLARACFHITLSTFWHAAHLMGDVVLTRVAPDIISDPSRNPAKFSYPAPAGCGRRIWGRIWPSFDASASLCSWAGIHCFTTSVTSVSYTHLTLPTKRIV